MTAAAGSPVLLSDDALLAACEVFRDRGSGPGGRHRNSTESRVTLRHRASGVEAHAGERRSQHENLAVAVFRLRCALAAALRTPRDPAARPSSLWISRTRGGRIACSPEHRDFPALLAEALDALSANGWDQRAAAVALGVTPTQLVRFIAVHREALDAAQRGRAALGLPPIRP